MTTDSKVLPIAKIFPDPNQPRKHYDKAGMEELTESVRSKGVLQTIMVRPGAGKGSYYIVYGERRYRAAIAAGLTELKVEIRTLTDDETREIQIVENLQRMDVHPMEESRAFEQLLETKKYSLQEIAGRVGKSEYHVRRRMKLLDLTAGWQELFLNNRIRLVTALQVAVLPISAQENLYQKCDERSTGEITINTHSLEQYKGDLKNAAFDITDPLLNPNMGACTTCRFNSSVAKLFPEAEAEARCSNGTCYAEKTSIHFFALLDEALKDPEMQFTGNSYVYNTTEKELTARVEAAGRKVLKEYQDFSAIGTEPKIPVLSDFENDVPQTQDDDDDDDDNDHDETEVELSERIDEMLDDDDDNDYNDYDDDDDENSTPSEREAQEREAQQTPQEQYDEAMVVYAGRLERYREKVKTALKAFALSGKNIGKIHYIHLNEGDSGSSSRGGGISKGEAKAAREAVEKGSATPDQLRTEIKRLEDREKRNKELDSQKLHTVIKEMLSKSESYLNNSRDYSRLELPETIACFLALHEAGSYTFQKWMAEKWGLTGRYSVTPEDYVTISKNITESDLNEALLKFVLDKLMGGFEQSSRVHGKALAIQNIVHHHHPDEVAQAKQANENSSEKRTAKVEKRLSDIKEQLINRMLPA